MKLRPLAHIAALVSLLLFSGLRIGLSQSAPQLGAGRKYTSVERMQLDHLRAVHRDRIRYASQRHRVTLSTGYNDYRGIMHAHAEDSAHTGGTREELLAAAKRTGVSVILLSDHTRPERDFIADSWRGLHNGVLFIPGAESEGYLVYPTASISGRRWKTREDYIKLIKESGGNIFLSHVEEKLEWPTGDLDGLEIYNHHTDVKDEVEFTKWLRGGFTDPVRLRQIRLALAEYPQEVFAVQQDYLAPIVAKWDRDAQQHRLTGIAANDCHHNQVFTIAVADRDSIELGYISSRPATTHITAEQAPGVAELTQGRKNGEIIARLDFDPYEVSLSYVTTHVLAEQLSEPAIRDALNRGHAYVAHDWLCDPTGFAFLAATRERARGVMGDEVALGRGLTLRVEAPVGCTLRLFRNGVIILSQTGDRIEFKPVSDGVYRVEAWVTVDGESRPWIYSNPIYVRSPRPREN